MTTAVQKITLSTSRDIPFNKLILSQANVRRIKAGLSVEELAEDIARRSLLQSLNVRPVLDADGNETGMYEVPAGGRRYRALEQLVKQKRLAKTAPVPCVVRDLSTDILAEDDSLAENLQRAPLHPLDQFRAFQALREKGQSEEDIAAAFFVSVNVVKQRLRLAAASPALLDIYVDEGMTLDQLMAFTVSPDHARQEQVWEAIRGGWQKEPFHIRRLLTESSVRASDRRVRFVGIDAFVEAGGVVLRDLFQNDDGGWIEDIALLDRLVGEKLAMEAGAVATEGWKWIDAAVSHPYGFAQGLRQLTGTPEELTPEQQSASEALLTEHDGLIADYVDVDDLPEAVDERLAELETAIAAIDNRPVLYSAGDMAIAGAFVSIDADGALHVDRGYVRPEDDPRAEGFDSDDTSEAGPSDTEARCAVITVAGQDDDAETTEGAIKPLPERLTVELTAHRTLALRNAVAAQPDVALTALLHTLVLASFFGRPVTSCLEAHVRHVGFPAYVEGLAETEAAKAINLRQAAWKEQIPGDEAALWDWLHQLHDDNRLALLAHCVSSGVNALYEKADRYGGGVSAHGVQERLRQADRLADAVGLNMVDAGWTPTVDNYLGRVTKPHILQAVREARGDQSAQLIDHLKKGDMAKEAERLLEGTGWLPDALREPIDGNDQPEAEGDTDALPDFLSDEDDGDLGDADPDDERAAAE